MDQRGASPCSFESPDPETTFEIAALLGRSIGARGLAIGLVGPLGSGKTVFVKGLAEGLGVDPAVVSSPTFVIAQQYVVPDGPELLHHLDLYRLESEAELEAIGFLDWLRPGQVLAVEWLDRFPDVLGDERLVLEFLPLESASTAKVGDTGRRRFRATAFGDEPARILRDWSERVTRLEREAQAAKAAGGGGRGRGDGPLAIVLVLAGLIGLHGVARDEEPPATGCAALAPMSSSSGGDDAERDELGPLRVVCTESLPPAGASSSLARFFGSLDAGRIEGDLEGMALLLDGGRLDPNEASPRLLENLPGIGAGRAEAIVRERARTPFASTRALERVPGIGPRTREKLEPWLAVDSGAPPG